MTFINKAILVAAQVISISSAVYANELSQGNDVAAYQAPNQLSDTVHSAPKSVLTKPVLPRFLDYVDIEPATNNPLYDEFLESPNSAEKFKQPVLSKESSAITAAPTMVRSAYTPACPTLNINTAYNLSGTVAGGSYCYHFNVAQKAKTQAFVIQQNAATNMTLVVLRHEANGSFTNLGVSNNPSNQDEKLLNFNGAG